MLKAATFPLQVLGYDVDAINTVQYTNHSGTLLSLVRFLSAFNIHRAPQDTIVSAVRKRQLMIWIRFLQRCASMAC